jgi:predicted ATPase
MKLMNLRIKNFKNIENVAINFAEINAIVGQNGTGKTNVINAIKFLKYFLHNGPERSITAAGGSEALFNQFNSAAAPIQIAITTDGNQTEGVPYQIFGPNFTLISIKIELTLSPTKDAKNVKNIKQVHTFKVRHEKMNSISDIRVEVNTDMINATATGMLSFASDGDSISSDLKKELLEKSFFVKYLSEVTQASKKERMKERSGFLFQNITNIIVGIIAAAGLDDVKMYSFDPVISKKPSEVGFNSVSFSEQGEYFSSILNQFDENEKEDYILTLQSFFPQVVTYSILTTPSHHEVVIFKERYGNNERETNFNSISDGMTAVALIIAAVKKANKSVVIIEEPERFIHPSIIARLLRFLKQEASTTQILITTHSPLVVNELDVHELVFIERKISGSSISRPIKKLPITLIEDLGLGDLYANSLI